ncbi:pteridine reductase [Salinimonas sp. HHU 13199]|uniref:Pteridine reductase n=1 Tax=Salinimonas profundi TaxID=2729140 RepID=A0ABR8LF47_9ALTE|nr:pteridine reductase [Salinimonas profundi]MBD3584882.1 pteridine reductase [Salinimonas profundi]
MTTSVALVTGGAKRIGAHLVKTLHQHGWRVIIHYHQSDDTAKTLCQALNEVRPDSAATVQGDLCNLTEISHIAAQARHAFGQIDLLVNNASSFYPTPVGQIDKTNWDALMGSNVQGPVFLIQALSDELQQQNGSVINLIDMHIDRPLPRHTVYCAAKSALASVTRSLAGELAPSVRVNGIAPGAILWPERELSDAEKQALLASIPLKELGNPADIAHAMLYLVDASYVTGQILYVDGGRSIASNASA